MADTTWAQRLQIPGPEPGSWIRTKLYKDSQRRQAGGALGGQGLQTEKKTTHLPTSPEQNPKDTPLHVSSLKRFLTDQHW